MGYTFPPVGRAWLPYVVLAVVGNCLPFWFITWGQKSIDSALAGILMAIMPLTTLLLAHFFVAGERMTRNRVAGFLLGFMGIVVLMGPAALAGLGGSPIEILAQLSVLAGALCYAANGVIIRVTLKGDVMVASAAIIAIAAVISVPVALVVDQPWRLAPGWTAVSILALDRHRPDGDRDPGASQAHRFGGPHLHVADQLLHPGRRPADRGGAAGRRTRRQRLLGPAPDPRRHRAEPAAPLQSPVISDE